jgi:Alr-MurF fusion protein
MPYSLDQVQTILQAEWLQRGPSAEQPLNHLLLDSRQLVFPERSLFLAMPGRVFNGHQFLGDLYQAGLRNMVVFQDIDPSLFPAASILKVDNILQALQQLAAHHRQQFSYPVIGITGSNGKTMVKEWLFQVLYPDFSIVRSPRSYNSQVGVPLSVWNMGANHNLAIFEAGVSRRGEMQKLAPIIHCELGIFTFLGEAHAEGFASKEEKLREKIQLFAPAKTVIYCCDDPLVEVVMREQKFQNLSWSLENHPAASLKVTILERQPGSCLLEAFHQGERHLLPLPFSDQVSLVNAIHCWATMLHLGLNPTIIRERMAHLQALPMRLELQEGQNGCLLVNDTYNADLNSLQQALHFLAAHDQGMTRSLILSDLLQTGESDEALLQSIALLLQEQQIQSLIGVGKKMPALQKLLPQELEQQYYPDTEALLQVLPQFNWQRQAILIKGAREFGLEKIAQQLSRQAHPTVLEINLSALGHNLRTYRRLLQPGVKLMVMIKAAAYGAGSTEVARMLEYIGVEYCCVAYADEGAELRQAGISAPIAVLNPEPASFNQLLRHRLEPTVYSLDQLKSLLVFLQGRELPLHLSLDSGMHRLGFDQHEIPALLQFLSENPGLKIASVFSHLAASEDPAHDEFTAEQARRFVQMYEAICRVLGYRPLRHLLNSNGISRFPQYQFDMVRLGIGLYGIDVSNTLPEPLQVMFSLKATISQVKEVAAGETIGYGRRALAQSTLRSGTISIGYADGLPRLAGNGAYQVLIRGQLAPILGSVCMDMCMVDLSQIPAAQAGDQVEVFGPHLPVDQLAQVAQTIPYEIFTGISQRVKRVYLQE